MTTDTLTDEEFFYAHASEHLDDELSGLAQDRFNKIIQDTIFSQKLDAFKQQRGRLQMILSDLGPSSKLNDKIFHLAQSKSISENLETHKLEEIGHKEVVNRVLRGLTLLTLASAIVFFTMKYFTPQSSANFSPLSALTYESIALDQDFENQRIDFPSDDFKEIYTYFSDSKELDFKPFPLLSAKNFGWTPIGASIIDYEITKILMTKLINNEQDFIYHYIFNFKLKDLAKGPEHNAGPIKYKAFESNELNLIAWQYPNDGPMGFLVGRLTHQDLAKIAAESVFK